MKECNCAVFGRPLPEMDAHKETCPKYALLQWHVSAPWTEGQHRDRIAVWATTAVNAIHAARDGFEPPHSIELISKSRNRTLLVDRFHFDVDGRPVTVEECLSQYPQGIRT